MRPTTQRNTEQSDAGGRPLVTFARSLHTTRNANIREAVAGAFALVAASTLVLVSTDNHWTRLGACAGLLFVCVEPSGRRVFS